MAYGIAARLAILLALSLAGCASVAHLDALGARPAPPVAIRFGVDTFAFPNESRAKNPDKPDLYANYCFVMARAVTQFHRFARFDPAAPRLDPAGYARRVSEVVARPPWRAPLAADERVMIPGYASLHDLSREQEAAVKEGLVGRLWTLLHWTNWRVVFPAPGWHQERVARETLAELEAGRPVQLLVTNFPTIELNHTVVAYDYRVNGNGELDLVVYDPNDPRVPGTITFDREARRFVATRLFDTTPGPIRAYRMYYGPLL
ncbi:MAG: hypothetical protein A2X52_07470 [Candidatus Rokubacteria bacterium GWC2_70_16]|nr:MAG: hypothetical protein A2X52_07470 [Candidatus Rokubacteria bacterium GWC2_70_16]